MAHPTFSILVPTHLRPEKFKRLMDSINTQTYTDFEVVINNDSDDVNVDAYDERFIIEYKKFDNLGDIFQSLYDRAKGQYLWVMEDDDYLANDGVLQMILDKFQDHPKKNQEPDMLLVGHLIKQDLRIITHGEGLHFYERFFQESKFNQVDFQFSDMIISTNTLDDKVDLSFLDDRDDVHNDYRVFRYFIDTFCWDIRTTNEIAFILTYGDDNLTWANAQKDDGQWIFQS